MKHTHEMPIFHTERRYFTSCVDWPLDVDILHEILDNNIEITRRTFIKRTYNPDLKNLEEELGYSKDFKMKDDWHVTYHSSLWPGTNWYIYYVCHSAIEYIFT